MLQYRHNLIKMNIHKSQKISSNLKTILVKLIICNKHTKLTCEGIKPGALGTDQYLA